VNTLISISLRLPRSTPDLIIRAVGSGSLGAERLKLFSGLSDELRDILLDKDPFAVVDAVHKRLENGQTQVFCNRDKPQ